MATLQPFPIWYATDDDGNPLVGGKVYTYDAGTSTPRATYTDSSGLTANSNPVILDASGRANIWFDDGLYKIILKDANDVELWSVDNVGEQSGGGGGGTTGGFGAATDIASATQVDLGSITSHFANITGATTITTFGSTASTDAPIYMVKFENALTLTNNSNILIPLGTDILTATNDHMLVEYLGSGIWYVIAYFRRDGSIDASSINCANLTVTNTANLP